MGGDESHFLQIASIEWPGVWKFFSKNGFDVFF